MQVAVVGTGYVGLTTGVCLASRGHQVTCVDTLPERIAAINSGRAPFEEPGLAARLRTAIASGRLHGTTALVEAVAGSEVIFITVGTPENDQGIDLSYVARASQQIGSSLRSVAAGHYRVIAVKSTVVPGTTASLVRSVLEEFSGQKTGEFGLCMNPEFLREGSAVGDFENPDRIVIGQWDDRSGQVLAALYESFDCPKILTTLHNAEMIKYASNALLATLVSFSNEIAALCEVTPQTDVEVVLNGVHLDRRLSPVIDGQRITPGILAFLAAGCGFGGSCLPKDVNALRAFARQRNVTPHLADGVMAVNTARPMDLVKLAEEALGSLSGSTVAVLGLAFKPGTDDTRESPGLRAIDLLLSKGAIVRAYDPVATFTPADSRTMSRLTVCRAREEALDGADGVLLVTAWPEFVEWDWPTLCRVMRRPIIVDGRNALRGVEWPAGATYVSIGRAPHKQQETTVVSPSS